MEAALTLAWCWAPRRVQNSHKMGMVAEKRQALGPDRIYAVARDGPRHQGGGQNYLSPLLKVMSGVPDPGGASADLMLSETAGKECVMG